MSGWIDLTRRLDDRLLMWPDRRPPDFRWERRIEEGHHCNVSSWSLGAHSGTHIDAPLHFIPGGLAVDELPLDRLAGPCRLIDMTALGRETLSREEAEDQAGVERLFLRTGFGESGEFTRHPQLLTPAAAAALLDRGLDLVGTDRLSVDPSDGSDFTLHRLLLGAGCVIVEGLNLASVPAGDYELCALPLPMAGAEASPARVVIRPA